MLLASPDQVSPPTGRGMVSHFSSRHRAGRQGWDICALPIKGAAGLRSPCPHDALRRAVRRLLAGRAYIVYSSNESGRPEVYVQEFPDPRTKVQVSSDGGGTEAFWSGDGKELFYRTDRLMAVPVETTPALGGHSDPLFQVVCGGHRRGHYRPAADGSGFS